MWFERSFKSLTTNYVSSSLILKRFYNRHQCAWSFLWQWSNFNEHCYTRIRINFNWIRFFSKNIQLKTKGAPRTKQQLFITDLGIFKIKPKKNLYNLSSLFHAYFEKDLREMETFKWVFWKSRLFFFSKLLLLVSFKHMFEWSHHLIVARTLLAVFCISTFLFRSSSKLCFAREKWHKIRIEKKKPIFNIQKISTKNIKVIQL